MGFDADEEASEEGQAFVSFFRLVQEHFIARTKPIPTFRDSDLSRIAVPVFAMLGGQDTFFDPNVTARRLSAFVADATVKTLPDAGHGLVDPTQDVMQFLFTES
jgi:pimeloyl-ACP methyl ester carboxylesterase